MAEIRGRWLEEEFLGLGPLVSGSDDAGSIHDQIPRPVGAIVLDLRHELSVWVTDYWNGTVRRVDAGTGQELDRILVGGSLRRVAAKGSRVWVLDTEGSVAMIPAPELG